MKVLRHLFTVSLLCSLTVSMLSPVASAQESDYLDSATQKATDINQTAHQSQQKIDDISENIYSKVQQYKVLLKEIDGLAVYNGQLNKQIADQVQEMADINSAIDEVSVIERQITPLMMNMIDGLEQFVALDVPFLVQERSDRIVSLKTMMNKANVAPSEKFRRVMEAYQVEMDYGRTIEAYSGFQEVNGVDSDVDFLRIGRTALLFQTRDGSSQGVWNKKSKQWDALDSSYRTQITKGLRMAKKQLAPDLIMVPVALTD